MARNQVHPESGHSTSFCAVDTELPGSEVDNQVKGTRRSIKLLAGTRTGLPGSGLSYMHLEESRVVGFVAPASNPSLDSDALPDRDWRGLLWIALIVSEIAAAVAQAMQ
jgi:hypothetical protein